MNETVRGEIKSATIASLIRRYTPWSQVESVDLSADQGEVVWMAASIRALSGENATPACGVLVGRQKGPGEYEFKHFDPFSSLEDCHALIVEALRLGCEIQTHTTSEGTVARFGKSGVEFGSGEHRKYCWAVCFSMLY
jgi:hypothetical protein